MKDLNTILKQIDTVKATLNNDIERLKDEAYHIFMATMETKQDEVKAMVLKVESSKDIGLSDFEGWPYQWTRVDFGVLGLDLNIDVIRDFLSQYLLEQHCIDTDFKNNALSRSQGPAILINDEGDILDQDSGQWVIKRGDYSNRDERNALIEAYMEKTGCFPSVVKCDRYGNASYVNTQGEKGYLNTKGVKS